MSRKSTTTEFIERTKAIHKNKYNYSKVNYLNNHTKVKIICKIHGEFLSRPNDHIFKTSGCPECGKSIIQQKESINLKEFIERAKKIHGDLYDYSPIKEIINNRTKVKYSCPKHGLITQQVSLHLNGRGCPECGKKLNIKLRTKTTEQFIQDAKKIHGNKYLYDKVIYKGKKIKVKIYCKKHDYFFQTPDGHLHAKAGCPTCKESHGEKAIRLFLERNKIKYTSQKTFQNCRNPKNNYLLYFDFYLPTHKLLIEYDGEQHFSMTRFNQTAKKYNESKHRDILKDTFCKQNNYNLLRIPYYEQNNINKIMSRRLKRT